jgi:hypothetical protein
MDTPLPTMVRHFRLDFDQTLDEPFHRAFDRFTHKVGLPHHVGEIVRQDPHKQPRLMGYEPKTARLAAAQRILHLFDLLLIVVATIVYLDHLPGQQLGIGNEEPDPQDEFSLAA